MRLVGCLTSHRRSDDFLRNLYEAHNVRTVRGNKNVPPDIVVYKELHLLNAISVILTLLETVY